MDLSKLPKRAAGTSEPSERPLPPGTEFPITSTTSSTLFAEAWISIGVGAFLVLWQPRFLQWLSSRLFHTHFNPFIDNATGAIVPYTTRPEFWSDLGPTLFAAVLIFHGIVMFIRVRIFLQLAFALTILTGLFNFIWVIGSYSQYGPAPLSFAAFILCGLILVSQWRVLADHI